MPAPAQQLGSVMALNDRLKESSEHLLRAALSQHFELIKHRSESRKNAAARTVTQQYESILCHVVDELRTLTSVTEDGVSLISATGTQALPAYDAPSFGGPGLSPANLLRSSERDDASENPDVACSVAAKRLDGMVSESLSALDAALQKLLERAFVISDQLRQAARRHAEALFDNDHSRAIIDDFKQNLNVLQEEVRDGQRRSDDASNQMNRLQEAADAARCERDSLQDLHRELQHAMSTRLVEEEERRRRAEQRIAELLDERESLLTTQAQLSDVIDVDRASFAQATAAGDDLRRTVAQLAEQMEAATRRERAHAFEREAARAERDSAQAERDALQAELLLATNRCSEVSRLATWTRARCDALECGALSNCEATEREGRRSIDGIESDLRTALSGKAASALAAAQVLVGMQSEHHALAGILRQEVSRVASCDQESVHRAALTGSMIADAQGEWLAQLLAGIAQQEYVADLTEQLSLLAGADTDREELAAQMASLQADFDHSRRLLDDAAKATKAVEDDRRQALELAQARLAEAAALTAQVGNLREQISVARGKAEAFQIRCQHTPRWQSAALSYTTLRHVSRH